MRLFGSAFNNLFGAILISRPPPRPLQSMESLQHAQDVYSLANELRVTPDVARTIIEGRELMRGMNEPKSAREIVIMEQNSKPQPKTKARDDEETPYVRAGIDQLVNSAKA